VITSTISAKPKAGPRVRQQAKRVDEVDRLQQRPEEARGDQRAFEFLALADNDSRCRRRRR
jgi:hypothetical protein